MNYLEQYGLSDRVNSEATMYPDLHLARVIAQYRGQYKIVTEHGMMTAEISGKMRHAAFEISQFPTVGDFVMVSWDNSDGLAIINRVLMRKSLFIRTASGTSGQAQPVASNIDTVFICMSLNDNYNLNRLERYLAVAWDSGAKPVIVLTKADLCTNLKQAVSEVEEVSFYCDVIPVSMEDSDIKVKFAKYIGTGTTVAFIGSSGVGKSTLINRLLDRPVQATKAIGRDDKGRHTTTGREMFLAPDGGVLIDTPGMRELGIESANLELTFDDLQHLAKQCKFGDCTHTNEPGCAILKALAEGKVDQRRVDSYLKLKNEAGYEGLSSREIEHQKAERMFKEVGGMKNVRKFVKEKRKKR